MSGMSMITRHCALVCNIMCCIIITVPTIFTLDVNECTFGTHDCDDSSRAKCINTEGSFKCECKPGYIGDGKSCHILGKE